MKKKFTLIVLFLFSINTNSQNLYENYESYFALFSSKEKNDVDIDHLVRFGFDDIFKYDYEDLANYKDSIHILSKIQNISIRLNDTIDLEKIIDHLEVIPNLKFLKIENKHLFRKPAEKLPFPTNLRKLDNLETIIFEFYSDWDYISGFNKLTKLPKLKNIGFYGFPKNLFLNIEFLKLKNLEGIFYSNFKEGPIIPKEFKNFKNLNTIILSVETYPNSEKEFSKFSKVKSLENLVLAYVKINDTIADSFKKFNFLKRLNLKNCKINSPNLLFSSIGRKNDLIELKLSNNKLETLPKEIKYFKNLEIFYSSNNLLGTKLPLEFYKLNKLKSIEIQGSTIETIDDKINNLKNLEVLKVYFNHINKFSDKLDNLKNLRTIYLNNNDLKTIPEQIEQLSSLNYLKIDDNKFNELPESLSHLKKLDTLICRDNKLTTLPKNFGLLNNLDYLDLRNNLINTLPESFGNLNSLQYLDLEQNDIQYLPDNFGSLHNLEQLYLNNRENPMRMFSFYDGNKFIPDTTRIERKLNDLKNLTPSFKNLKKLNNIRLTRNENIDANSVFSMLKNASFKNYRLELDYCNIDSLPNDGWSAIKVKSLNVSNNSIRTIPADIKNTEYLSELNVQNNIKNLNTYRSNREQINLLLEEEGILTKEQQPKTKAMAIAYAEIANKKAYSNQYDKVVEYAERAIAIDEEAALQKLRDYSYIEALYKTENYKKAIKHANLAIKNDTSKNVRLLNFIIPNFKNKAKSELAIGDTLSAIETLSTLAKRFNQQSWSEVGILAKRIGNDPLTTMSFNNAINFYEEYIEKRPNNWGYQLSLLEMYVIADKKESAQKLYSKLTELIDDGDYKILLEYFKVALNIIYEPNLNTNEETKRFQSFLTNKKTKLDSWSFELFLDWNEINKLSAEKKLGIKKITNLLRRNDLNFFY